ncbi:MAG: 16S rRNA (adenine(1518)-N(6)/adenine(1519)-N(6))-dimethyltransferase RsmA [Treponema sp.]|nr:16S rRNA (adenine(1518)-N(6)/adenine(1519)-N(6))-dimethyltransferase RsmA [Treponema sp.]
MRKKFGQNFLINPRARSGLLDAMELREGDDVWEIGPGLGAMTTGLLERGARVTAFEIDPAFAAILREHFAPLFAAEIPGTFRLVEGDALKTWRKVPPAEETLLFGNLPYNAAAALLADFIEGGRFFKRMVVTVQREVALRMTAKPGSSDYSSFSVLCSSVYKVSPLFVIKGSSFYPAPRVDSQGVRLDLLPRGDLPKLFYPLVRGLFSSRRKAIRNTLSAFAASVIIKPVSPEASSAAKETAAEVLNRANISGDRRPETLDNDEFAALAAFLEEIVCNE